MSDEEQEETRASWAEAMKGLTAFLYQQRSKDAALAARLTLLELPNLLALLEWVEGRDAPEAVVNLAGKVESLLSRLGRSRALVQATKARERAAKRLSELGDARFKTESASIDRLIERGEVQAAYDAAQQLLKQSLAAGEEAHSGADYDIAMAHLRLGRVLQMGGAAELALPQVEEARRRFEALADAGDTDATVMISVAFSESGNSLIHLGRLDKAAVTYEEAGRRAYKLGNKRGVAVSKGNLGTVRMLQKRYPEALKMHHEARCIFESMGEPGSVGVAWHQIGMVHNHAGEFEQAERAYRRSLAVKVQQHDLSGEAISQLELGNLYNDMERLDEAVTCCRQSAGICVRLKEQIGEGRARNNLSESPKIIAIINR